MTTQYTSLLGLALPVTGELSGTWGDVVNDSITQLVEDSIANYAEADVTSGDWTLTTTGTGATNQARMMILRPYGTPGVSRNIIAPSKSKMYLVINSSDDVVVLKGSATTGVAIQSFVSAVCAWDGSDFVVVSDVTGPASSTDTAIAIYDGSTGKIIKNTGVTIDGSNNVLTVGNVTAAGLSAGQVDITAQGDLRLQDTTGGQYVALQSPGTLASSYTLTLPGDDGNANQVLTTDGSGTLSWSTPSSGISTGKSIAMAMIFGF